MQHVWTLILQKYPTYLLSETEAKTLLHVLEEKINISFTNFSPDIFACVKHLWMFSLTSQTSGREPASRRTSSLNATVLNSPLCLLYLSWHPFSSREPKTALHYKTQQKCMKNKRTKKNNPGIIYKNCKPVSLFHRIYSGEEFLLFLISTHFTWTAFSSWVRVKQPISMSVTDAYKHDPHKLFWLSWNSLKTNTV